MGFKFSDYSSKGAYLTPDEKRVIAESGIPFTIDRVEFQPDNQFNGRTSPRFVLHVTVPNPETGDDESRLLPFPQGSGVQSRDDALADLVELSSAPDYAPVRVKLGLHGRSFVLRDA